MNDKGQKETKMHILKVRGNSNFAVLKRKELILSNVY